MEDWNQRAVDARLETTRVWQVTNKRVSTRNGVRRLRFLSLITITIAARRSDGVSPWLPRSPTMSTATRYRKCESSVMGNWSEQTRIEDFVKRGNVASGCYHRIFFRHCTADIARRILKIPVSQTGRKRDYRLRCSIVSDLFAIVAILILSCNAHSGSYYRYISFAMSKFPYPAHPPSISPIKFI